LSQLTVDDGVEIDDEEVSVQDSGKLFRRLGLACPRCSLKQELVDPRRFLYGVDDAHDGILDL